MGDLKNILEQINKRISAVEEMAKNMRGEPLITGYTTKMLTLNDNLNVIDLLKRLVAVEALMHARQHSIVSTSDHTSNATAGLFLKADSSGLPVEGSATELEAAHTHSKLVASDGSPSPALSANATGNIEAVANITALSDNGKLQSGASSDMAVYYDGTNGNIDTAQVAPSDLKINCGGTGATVKTVVLDVPVYDDLYFEISPKTTGSGKPALASFSGDINQYTMAVNDVSECRPPEIKHDAKEGEPLELHVHWATNGSEVADHGVKWQISYTWANTLASGGTTSFEAATPQSSETLIPAGTADKTHMYTSVYTFTPTGFKVGAIILLAIKRIASVTNTAPSADPWIFNIGVHYKIDTMGSRQISTK